MTNDQPNPNNQQGLEKSQDQKRVYDLEERTAQFAEQIIDFSKRLPHSITANPLITQLVRAGTSIGANYCEADEASSKKDFVHKISIAKKETKETRYWLRMIAYTLPEFSTEAKRLWKEAQELNLIFAAITRKAKQKP